MQETSVFFDKKGLTETSANYIANLAKETLKKDEADIAAISFIHQQMSLVNDPKRADIHLGMDEAECRGIAAKLEHIMKVKSLIAWLREAIKEKQRLHNRIEQEERDEFLKEWDEQHKTDDAPIADPLTDETYLDSLPIAERCRIYALKTEAATFGKVIHDKGALATAREKMLAVKHSPTELVRSGVNNFIYYYEPSIDGAVVDEVYFVLQKRHREIQAELNAHLQRQTEAIRLSNMEYEEKLAAKWENDNNRNEQRRLAWSQRLKQRHHEVSELKIVIPNELRSIYEEIQHIA